MTETTFGLLCQTKSQYIPPFKLLEKRYLGVSVSPEEQIMDTIKMRLESTDSFVKKHSIIPLTKDIDGEIKKSIAILSRVNDIDWKNYHPARAGVIPYIKEENNILFCLGEDNNCRQLTDFGGGVGMYETSLTGALRELEEESLGIFGPISPELLNTCPVVTSKCMTIIFLPVNLKPETYVKMFSTEKESASHLEVSNIFWLTQYQMKGLIEEIYTEGRVKIFHKVKHLLEPIFNSLLKIL